jgi:hypothetical protein
MSNAVNYCLNCGEPITKGRSDKKFCDQECKNVYYNRIKIQENGEIKRVDLALKKNRRILKKLFDPRKMDKLVNRDALLKAGFDFDFHTHFVTTKFKGNQFVFCYDYGYREVEKHKFKVIKSFK